MKPLNHSMMNTRFLFWKTFLRATTLSVVLTAGCGEDDATEGPGSREIAIAFAPSFRRADGPMTDALPEGIGVFACHTGQEPWDGSTEPEFMSNQLLERTGGAWSYLPVKNWPAQEGDRVSFFAYAPYAGTDGVAVSDGSQQEAPVLRYRMPSGTACHTDIYLATPRFDLQPGERPVDLELRSVMARIAFSIKGHGEKITKIAIKGIQDAGEIALDAKNEGTATWNLTSGITQTEYLATLGCDPGEDYVTATGTMTDVTAEQGYICLLPQNITYNARLVVTVDGVDKSFPMKDIYQWQPGETYRYHLSVPDSEALDYTDNHAAPFLIAPLDGSIDLVSWQDAMEGCPEGYRLPTQNEGMLILLYKDGIPDNAYRSASYWTSTTYAENEEEALFYDISYRITGNTPKYGITSYRCITDAAIIANE